MKKEGQCGTTCRLIHKFCVPDVLVIDEMNYFPFDELCQSIISDNLKMV
jgi:DNA replication protein DnaC